MEIVHGFKYSKVEQQNNVSVGVPTTTRVWRSVKRVACRFMRRQRRQKLVVRRVVSWACVELKKRTARKRSSNNVVILNYDMFSYSNNFDDGNWQQEDVDFYGRRSFSYRFVDMHVINKDSPFSLR